MTLYLSGGGGRQEGGEGPSLAPSHSTQIHVKKKKKKEKVRALDVLLHGVKNTLVSNDNVQYLQDATLVSMLDLWQ